MSDKRPNILLIMTDQQKADSLAVYGNQHVKTPAIDRLAREGIVVDGMICNYPACTPGRSAVMTGRYPHTNGVRANHLHLPEHELSLPVLLDQAGYRQGLVGKNHVFPDGTIWSQFRVGRLALREYENLPRQPRVEADLRAEGLLADQRSLFETWETASHFGPDGDDFVDLRAFASRREHWRSFAAAETLPFPADRCTSAVLGDRAATFVRDGAQDERPWFLWLSFPDPHNPYLAPEPFASMYDPDVVDIPPDDPMTDKPERHAISKRMNGMQDDPEDIIRKAVAMQYGQVSAIDDGIERVLRALDETGQRENTIVVFTTDHGGYVGDHGSWHKSLAFFDCLIRLPMIVSWPGTLAPRRLTDGFMEQVDVLPTLLDFIGLKEPPGVQGRSMAAAFTDGAPVLRDVAFAEGGEAGTPVTWDDLPFMPDDPLDSRYFGWDGFLEAWIGQGKMLRSATHKYVWWANGEEELYDLVADPGELRNIAAREDALAFKIDAKDQLLQWTVATEDQLAPHTFNVGFDDVLYDRLPF
jgi:arylsulfatase